AWVHLRRAEYGEAASALDRAERLLGSPATDGQPADGRLRSLRSCLRRAAGDDEGAVAHARAALAALDASDTFHRGAATGTLYAGLRGLGRRDEAERVAAGALEEDADVGARSRGRLLGLMCELHWLAGDSGALEAAVSRCEDLARGERLPAPMAVAQLYRGLLGFDRNELPRAEEHLHASLESIDLLSPLQALQLRFGLACVYQAQGRHSAAQRMAEDANLALPEAHGEASPGRHLHSQRMLEADLALKCGDPDRALERIGGRADSHAAAVPSRLDPQLLQARALLIREDEDGWDLAGKLIERLQDADDTVPGDTLAIEHGLLEALWRVRIGDEETALERIGACLGLAERSGVVRCFFDLGTALPDLLKPHSRRGPHTAFVRRVLSAYYEDRLASGGANNASDDGASAPRINPVDALTPTENETLLLLNKGLYNREIAERRFVSVETVKTHLKNIYRKLNVSDRRQAVTRARALGLVARD
ncbi:MAG: LuxR C-terminal-related transcriptional regulator, partial [Gemmatimonadota bacterium]